MTPKFKVGDMVEAVEPCIGYFKKGTILTIINIGRDDLVYFKEITGGWFQQRFKLAKVTNWKKGDGRMKLKIGDSVMISKDSEFYGQNYSVGIIREIHVECGEIWIKVIFEGGSHNSYRSHDLIFSSWKNIMENGNHS